MKELLKWLESHASTHPDYDAKLKEYNTLATEDTNRRKQETSGKREERIFRSKQEFKTPKSK